MKNVRTVVAAGTLVLMTGGYFASQYAYFVQGRPTEYAQRIDSPLVSYLALVLFLAIVVLGCIPDKTAPDESVGAEPTLDQTNGVDRQ